MTYFGFLALFLGLPITLLLAAAWWDRRQGRGMPGHFGHLVAWQVLLVHVLIALTYTTPWDNYLVATGVWWYDPALVTGITLGWVPIEEYTFFLVQPIFTGLWLLWLMRRDRSRPGSWDRPGLRRAAVATGGLLWAGSVALLLSGWSPGTYLALELGWALPPILLQLFFGADILWRYRRLVLLGLLPTTLYLAAADALAIQSGTWTINPDSSLNWMLGGVLPVEEFIFFLITNVLIVFGMTLALASESQARIRSWRAWWTARSKAARPQAPGGGTWLETGES